MTIEQVFFRLADIALSIAILVAVLYIMRKDMIRLIDDQQKQIDDCIDNLERQNAEFMAILRSNTKQNVDKVSD